MAKGDFNDKIRKFVRDDEFLGTFIMIRFLIYT